MPSYGYKIFAFRLTPHYKLDPSLAFDDVQLGAAGAQTAIHDGLGYLEAAAGEADNKTSSYFRVDELEADNWGILVTASGGSFGEEGEVVDVLTGQQGNPIGANDAVIRQARTLLIVPPSGTWGLVVSETRGRSHLTPSLVKQLNKRLSLIGVTLRTDREVADEVAWNDFLDQSDVRFSRLEFVQYDRPGDGTQFTDGAARRAVLGLTLVDTNEIQTGIRGILNRARPGRHDRPKFAELVGLRGYDDDAFDEERVIMVQDGRERRLNVTQGWPSFVYQIDSDEQLDDSSFLATVREASEDTLEALGVALPPANWWPNL